MFGNTMTLSLGLASQLIYLSILFSKIDRFISYIQIGQRQTKTHLRVYLNNDNIFLALLLTS